MAFQILGDSVIDHNHIITSPKLILEGTSASESIISGLLNGESKLEIKSDGSASFAGEVTISGNLDMTGSIVPSVDNVYDLGSPTKMWRDVYIGPGSLYVNGQKIVEADDADNIILSSSSGQNLVLKPTGLGDLELAPEGGIVQVKAALQIQDGTNITNSAGNAISFSNSISAPSALVNEITSKSANGDLVLSGSGSGIVRISDGLNVVGTANVDALTIGGNSVDTSAQVDTKISTAISAIPATDLSNYDTSSEVTSKINTLLGGAPAALDTLNELAASIGDDADFAGSMTNLLSNKANISSLATVATSGSYSDLSNKPSIPTHTSHLTNNSGFITNSGGTEAPVGSTVVKRNSSGDINCRLVKPTYQNESTISGAIAYRVNPTSNNYVRFCSNPSAVRAWLGAGTSSFDGNYNSLSNKPSIPTHTSHLTNNSGYITSSSLPTHTSHLTNNSGFITSADGGNADNLDGHTWTSGTNAKFSKLEFTGVGGNSNNGGESYAIYQESGAWSHPYPDLVIGYHTGIKIGGHKNYNGTRFYNDSPAHGSEIFSVGNGDDNVRVVNNLYIQGNIAWHQGNDGSGSGLDADLLDGQQGSFYNQSQFTGSAFTSRNSGNPIAIDSATHNTIGYTNISSAAGYSDGGLFTAAYSSSWVSQIFSNFRDGHLSVRGKNNGTWQSWHKVWDSGNDGSGSGLDADLWDGNQFSSYLNQAVLTSSSPTFTEVYANNWFRNNQANEGLYNQATGAHFYAQSGNGVWNLTGNTQNVSTSLIFRGTHAGNIEGWLHADGGNYFGLLNDAGQWALKQFKVDGYSPNLWFDEEGNESWTGNPGNDEGKIEYHSNRFYIASGANSTEVVRFRRSSTDVGYVANDGNMYLTSSNHKVYHAGNKPSLATLGYTGATNADHTGSTPTFSEVYTNGWFRNNQSGEGLYNTATGQHFYSDHDDLWNIAGGSGANAIRFRDEAGGTIRGYVYANNSSQIGFLNSGGSWSLKVDNSGNLTATNNVTAYSDIRIKENVRTIDNALDKVTSMRGVYYNRKDSGKACVGVIAQEIEQVLPEVIDTQDTRTKENPDGLSDLKTVAYGNMVGLLIESIKEQQKQIDEQQNQIKELKEEIEAVKQERN